MKKRFKKIYVEITNRCNLNCSFCGVNKRKYNDMSLEEFQSVVEKIKAYTDYIYLHVKGEPLLHPFLDDILTICDNSLLKVNITTNGVFLKEKKDILLNHPSVRQINISLHSENNKSSYFDDIFSSCKILASKMFISYRIWDLNNLSMNKKSTGIVNKIISSYNLSPAIVDKIYHDKDIKIASNTFVKVMDFVMALVLILEFCQMGLLFLAVLMVMEKLNLEIFLKRILRLYLIRNLL